MNRDHLSWIFSLLSIIVFAAGLFPVPAHSELDSLDRAYLKALVEKAIVARKACSTPSCMTDLTDLSNTRQFADNFGGGGGYVVLYTADGHVLAHAKNRTLVGTDQSRETDADGKPYVAEIIALAKKEVPFSLNYKFKRSWWRSAEDATVYCVPWEAEVVCAWHNVGDKIDFTTGR
jgi:signal transduction histidine kinase